MAVCTSCGNQVEESASFCTSCGKPMPAAAQPFRRGNSCASGLLFLRRAG